MGFRTRGFGSFMLRIRLIRSVLGSLFNELSLGFLGLGRVTVLS